MDSSGCFSLKDVNYCQVSGSNPHSWTRDHSWTKAAAAVVGMILVDAPICHNVLMPTVSLISSFVLYGIATTAKQLGYVYSFTKLEMPSSDVIHEKFHESIHYAINVSSKLTTFISSGLLENEINSSAQNVDHEDHNHHKDAHHHCDHEEILSINTIVEPLSEIGLGWISSKGLPQKSIEYMHGKDPLHYIVPGWHSVENAAPSVANGHAVAEGFWLVVAVGGPVWDVSIKGVDPADLVAHYGNELWGSVIYIPQKILELSTWSTSKSDELLTLFKDVELISFDQRDDAESEAVSDYFTANNYSDICSAEEELQFSVNLSDVCSAYDH